MTGSSGNRPAEIFGFPAADRAMPKKDEFVRRLNAELRLKLNMPSAIEVCPAGLRLRSLRV